MTEFIRRNGKLYCEQVPLDDLARRFDTPLYVYSRSSLCRQYLEFEDAFSHTDHIICFAAKANSSHAVLKTLGDLGAGADIVSGGELYRAMKAGIDPQRIVYSGVGKTIREMEEALEADILLFNIESFSELSVLNDVATRLGKRAKTALRVNPDVDPQTHPYVATGLKTSKFGIHFESVFEGYERTRKMKGIEVVGIDCHIGSQLSSIEPFIEAIHLVRDLMSQLRDKGFNMKYLDVGGGLGIKYEDETPPCPKEYGQAVRDALAQEEATLILEPGRSIAGNAGVLLTRVLYTKKSHDRRFAIVDAGMNDLMRPSLYNSFHAIEPVEETNREVELTDIVGPICESGDFIARERNINALQASDLIAVMSAGAYGASMSSTYNSRPLAAEVMVDKGEFKLIRERGNYEDLVRGES